MATDPNTVASYNANAEAYNAHVTNPQDSIFHAYYEKPAIRTELPDLAGLKVISIGCGSGVDAEYLKNKGAAEVTGVDISEGMISIAKRDHPGINFSVMDMEKLDFPDESFDTAYSSLAIHYLDDWTAALKETCRVLKPGGKYIFSCGHPLDGSMERTNDGLSKASLLGKSVSLQTDEHRIYGDYLAAEGGGVKKIEGGLATIDVVTYHQTTAKMIQYIVESGFTIEKLVEPLPLEQMREHSAVWYDMLMKVPTFMIWVLRK